jgi:MFS family permease
MALGTQSPNEDATAGRAGFGARFALILIALLWASQLNGLVGLMGSNAQSLIAIHYHTTQIAWFGQVGLLAGVFATPFVVKLAGMYGKKRLLVIVTALGFVGDLIAALSTNYETLLVGRAIAGTYAPSLALVYAMARDVFPPKLVGPASGFLGGGMGVLALGGPFLSGWIIDDFGYRGVLWFMAVATAISLLAVTFLVPESPVREARAPIDWVGGILLGGGLAAIIYGVGQGATWGWTSGKTVAFVGGGLVAVIAFVLAQRKASHPLFPVSLLGRRRVWSTFLVAGLTMGAVYAQGTVMNLLALMPKIPGLSDGLGWSATKNALISAPGSVVLIVTATVVGGLARRIDSRKLFATGGALVAIGIALVSQFHYTAAQFIGFGLISAIGMGMVVALVPIMVIESVRPEEQALGNGAQNMMQGVLQGVLTQLAFVVVAQKSNVMNGTAFYVDSGYTRGFLLFAGVVAFATALVLLIPKAKSLDEVKVGQAAF